MIVKSETLRPRRPTARAAGSMGGDPVSRFVDVTGDGAAGLGLNGQLAI